MSDNNKSHPWPPTKQSHVANNLNTFVLYVRIVASVQYSFQFFMCSLRACIRSLYAHFFRRYVPARRSMTIVLCAHKHNTAASCEIIHCAVRFAHQIITCVHEVDDLRNAQARKTWRFRLDPAWVPGGALVSPAISASTVDLPAMFVHACFDMGCRADQLGVHKDDVNFYRCEEKHGFSPEEVFKPR